MKLWIVVRLAGELAMSVGPLPRDVDMAECRERAAQKLEETRQVFEERHLEGDPRMVVDGKQIGIADVAVECVEAPERPR